MWPTGQPRPLVSTLNSFDGRIKANAAIVPAGSSGSISAFVTDTADLVVDINGYFAPATTGASYFALTPCRIADTRYANGINGGPSLSAGQTRTFDVANRCNLPHSISPVAYALNVTVIPRASAVSYLTIWPTGVAQPLVSTLNAPTTSVVANAAVVGSGVNGFVSVYSTDAADVVIDINGYFALYNENAQPLSFFPVTPCRAADTRNASGEYGGPALAGAAVRTFGLRSACGVSAAARAYSLNATVVPAGTLSYLTVWPAGQTQPVVSTLNSFDASIVSNAALVAAGSSGAISAFATGQTHLILDINGFFAPE